MGMPNKGVAVSGKTELAEGGGGAGAGVPSKDRCAVRNKLKKGGQMYCGFMTGKYDQGRGVNSLYPGRCTIFVSSRNITIQGPFNNPYEQDPNDHHNTPYIGTAHWKKGKAYKFHGMTNYPCKINIEAGCAPEPEEMCEESSQSHSDCQAACSELTSDSGCYDPCVMDCCATGNSDPEYLESHMMGCYVSGCLAGLPGPCTIYEAEDARADATSLKGDNLLTTRGNPPSPVRVSTSGFTGAGWMMYPQRQSYLEWTVPSAEMTKATVKFRYAHGKSCSAGRQCWKDRRWYCSESQRHFLLTVNGADVHTFVLECTRGWVDTPSITLTLEAGSNILRLAYWVARNPSSNPSDTGIDSMTVCVSQSCSTQSVDA